MKLSRVSYSTRSLTPGRSSSAHSILATRRVNGNCCVFRWCPSIAWMKYAQRAHACCQLLMHGIRSTSGWGSGMRHPPLSSGGGVLRCVRRTAEIPSRDAGPDSRSFGSRSLSAVRVLDRPSRSYPVTPSMAAGMMDSVWTMEALLAGPARPVSDQRHCVALSSTLSRDTTQKVNNQDRKTHETLCLP